MSNRERPPRRIAALAGVMLLAAVGCAGQVASPVGQVLAPADSGGARVPDSLDRAAHDLAAAALVGTPVDAAAARERLDQLERARIASGEPASGLSAHAQHVVDATLDDPIAYREANRNLLERDDLDPALARQLEIEVKDDPLLLARARMRDARHATFARWFNAFASAAGRSMTSFQMAPMRMARAAMGLAVKEHLDDPISLQERQALHHWKRYVEAHPEAPTSAELVERIARTQRLWFETKRQRSLRSAQQGLDKGYEEIALLFAERALHYAPGDPRAEALRDRAARRVTEKRRNRAASLAAAPELDPAEVSPAARALAVSMLLPNTDPLGVDSAGDATDPGLVAARHFARASALREQGRESAMWSELAQVAQDGDGALAHHAQRLLDNPRSNPYRAFRRARSLDRKRRASFVLLGPMARGPRELYLPRALEWIIDGPAVIGTLGGIPSRLVQTAFRAPPARTPLPHARRYLRHHPEGEHAGAVREWLFEFETERKNWVGAHQIAQQHADVGADELEDLAEKAADQTFRYAEQLQRRDLQFALFREIADRYPNTSSGQRAKRRGRELLQDPSSQEIRISRGFLEENPRVAGPLGLGIRPALLDGEAANGELHPDGVTLTGGQTLEVALLGPSGNPEDPAETRAAQFAPDQLARLVSLLDETAHRNALTDPLATHRADADRDLYFERARLGVAGHRDVRATATSRYAFTGVREKYDMVRSHEPLLPFDLVIQGTVPDLGFGAFPQIRPPAETPDAILYR